jgi:uncharacterized protein (DUF58 family)
MAVEPQAAGEGALKGFQLREHAERLASAYPPLLIKAERIADTIVIGVHGRRKSGAGEDFWQYRPYSPGDPATGIDWRKSGRSDRIFVRENEWAATNTLWLWVARNPGMGYRSDLAAATKFERATLIAATLAVLAVRAGERVALVGSPHPPGHTRGGLVRLVHWLGSATCDDPGAALPPADMARRHATAVLIGDFLEPAADLGERLRSLADNGIKGHLVQVLDPSEETFPFLGRTEFREFEGSRKLLAGRAQALREAYVERLHRHREAMAELARRLGWSFFRHTTDRSVHAILLTLYALLGGQPQLTAGTR